MPPAAAGTRNRTLARPTIPVMTSSPVDDHDRPDELDEQDRVALRQLATLTPSERLEAFVAECRPVRQVSQAVPLDE